MPAILEKPPTTEQPEVAATSKSGKLLPISFAVISISIVVVIASLQNVTKADEDQLEALQAKVENREPLEKYEKEAYCELLWKVKQVRLCACKKNFIEDIGSVTGYKVKNTDLDWRDSGKTFEEALQEAFKRTRSPLNQFKTAPLLAKLAPSTPKSLPLKANSDFAGQRILTENQVQ
ncbi:MAG: hypothetical protein KBF93_13680 [Leptospiraceae bacterium]|nr:hypothetical protein [Leptospiraceae bacterium]